LTDEFEVLESLLDDKESELKSLLDDEESESELKLDANFQIPTDLLCLIAS
jgi:hypothetical protein